MQTVPSLLIGACADTLFSIFNTTDKSTVKETSLQVTGPETLRIKWKKPRDKYKVFSYRVFVKWNDTGIENMLEVYDGNATSCVYSIKRIAETFHVMAYVVRQIPLIPIFGKYYYVQFGAQYATMISFYLPLVTGHISCSYCNLPTSCLSVPPGRGREGKVRKRGWHCTQSKQLI